MTENSYYDRIQMFQSLQGLERRSKTLQALINFKNQSETSCIHLSKCHYLFNDYSQGAEGYWQMRACPSV